MTSEETTFWNGDPTPARRVEVRVPPWDSEKHTPLAWWRPFERTWRKAVKVEYVAGIVIYLDDEDGSGWRKVTEGRGSPRLSHRQLPNNVMVRGCRPRFPMSDPSTFDAAVRT